MSNLIYTERLDKIRFCPGVLGKLFGEVILRVIQEFLENSCLVAKVILDVGELFRNSWRVLLASYFESYARIFGEFFGRVVLKVIQWFLENSFGKLF